MIVIEVKLAIVSVDEGFFIDIVYHKIQIAIIIQIAIGGTI